MNNELQAILSYIEKDRGISREVLLEAVESAMQSAARRSVAGEKDLRIEIDRQTYDIKAYAERVVVATVKDPRTEIDLAEARLRNPAVQLGDIAEKEVTPRNFGRIAAQTAKQAITQKIRQAEREIVFEEYKDRVGDIVTGTVRQFNRSDIVVDLGRADAIMPSRERVPIEEYQIGDRIRAYILSVLDNGAGPSVTISRSHPDFVRRLFELEVSEIADKIVEIKGIAREPGYRTKIAVASNNEKVDPVGACVGMRGMRVKNIVRELSGEKIDIIRWSDDVRTYVINALSPAKLSKVTVSPEPAHIVEVIADSDQLSLAIGKRGQNVRLSAKLIGWKIDIHKAESEFSFEEKVERAIENLADIAGITREQAEQLVNAGFLTVEGILAVDLVEFPEMTGFDPETAESIYEAAAAIHGDDD